MDLLINKRQTRRSDISGVRADEAAPKDDGPLPTHGDAESPTSEVLLPEEVPAVYCRQCDTCVPLSTTRPLSIHPTSEGPITYFRCEEGHADFYFGSQSPSD